jgi:hypothetical protein
MEREHRQKDREFEQLPTYPIAYDTLLLLRGIRRSKTDVER